MKRSNERIGLVPVGEKIEAEEKKEPARAKKTFELSAIQFVWLVSVTAVVLVFILQPFYPSFIGTFSNLATPVIAACALMASVSCLRKYGSNFRGRFDRVWIYFVAGMASWTCAEITWGIYYFVLRIPIPYPSVADLFYIGAYFPVSLALFTYFVTFRAGMTRRKYAISLVTIAAAVGLVFAFVLPVEFAEAEPPLQVVSDLIYPVLDLVLLSLATLSIVLFAKGKLGVWWLILAAGIIFDVLGDELFLYLTAGGTYYNGSFDDLLYDLAYFMFILAFYTHKRQL